MKPTINVNLKPCNLACHGVPSPRFGVGPEEHHPACNSNPILIPCPVPRTVEMTVRLGECFEAAKMAVLPNAKTRCGLTTHHEHCPARPIRVSCSIVGACSCPAKVVRNATARVVPHAYYCQSRSPTWANSDVAAFEEIGPARISNDEESDLVSRACRERWALVKALMLDTRTTGYRIPSHWRQTTESLFSQRDAVFSALVDMERAEDALSDAVVGFCKSAPGVGMVRSPEGWWRPPPNARAAVPASHHFIAAYVEHVIAQVGAMDGDAPNSPGILDGSPNPSMPSNGSGEVQQVAGDHDIYACHVENCPDCERSIASDIKDKGAAVVAVGLASSAGLPVRVVPRYPCSTTCTHDDARTPGHPERVKERSEEFNEAIAEAVDVGLSSTAAQRIHDQGAEAMRAACLEAVQEYLDRSGLSASSPALVEHLKAAIEGAKP